LLEEEDKDEFVYDERDMQEIDNAKKERKILIDKMKKTRTCSCSFRNLRIVQYMTNSYKQS